MEFRQLSPAPDLDLFVQHYWTMAGVQSGELAHPIFPDGAPELVFNFGDPVRQLRDDGDGLTIQPQAILVGQMMRAIRIVPTGCIRMVGVKLAPWGASAFFGDAAEWRDRIVPLPGDWSDLASLADPAVAACDHRVASCLDDALRSKLAIGNGERLRRLTVVARALSDRRVRSVDAWSQRLGWSSRTLARHFDSYVGLSPKELLRIHRFQRALRLGTEAPRLTLGTVAARAGYYDQSHLVRDFRAFTGAPPSVTLPTLTDVSTHFVSDVETSMA